MLDYYLERLDFKNIPDFLVKYLNLPSLLRLKEIGYFCGMDFASKDIYNFKENISRYDHSLTVALITWKFTKDKSATVAALFHDIATPCFSHVIDYMNQDYERQESTEEYTGDILKKDEDLQKYLQDDAIDINNIINFKKYSIVDNDRPKVCADRIDGIVLTGIAWTNNITKEDIRNIVSNMCLFINEYGEEEIGFNSISIAKKVLEVNESIDLYCHSKEDNYMMQLLAIITKLALTKKYIVYEDLFDFTEMDLFNLFDKTGDNELRYYINKFKTIKKSEIEDIDMPNIKRRVLNPIVNGRRLK